MNKKRILSICMVICILITITSIGANPDTAYAAAKKYPLKVKFNGTSVSLIQDLNTSYGRGDSPKLKTVENKWGKPSQKKSNGTTTYTWKKGKTSIKISDYDVEKGGVGSIDIDIKDKNGSLCGVKVGMKKATAVKKLKNALGKKPTSDSKSITAYAGPYMPISIALKNGKVSSIYWCRS